jgi:hypothetical protein
MWMINMAVVIVVVIGGLLWCLRHIAMAKDGE